MTTLDEYKHIDVEKFERAIAVGRSMSQVRAIFGASAQEMDKFTQETYGNNYATVYGQLKQIFAAQYASALEEMSLNGHNKAMDIMANMILNDDQATDSGITFNINVNKVGDEDKDI